MATNKAPPRVNRGTEPQAQAQTSTEAAQQAKASPISNAQTTGMPVGTPPALSFDATAVKSSYANFANINSTREEVVLNLGVDRSWEHAGQQRTVELHHRVMMSPFAAKRLSKMLQELVAGYEAKYGVLKD